MSRRAKHSQVPAPEWAAISVDYFLDPEIANLTPALREAHIRLILTTVRLLTDGEVTPLVLKWADVTKRKVDELEAAGLVTHGRLKGWHKWQKPRDVWVKTFEAESFGGRMGNCVRWHADDCRCTAGEPIKKRPKT